MRLTVKASPKSRESSAIGGDEVDKPTVKLRFHLIRHFAL